MLLKILVSLVLCAPVAGQAPKPDGAAGERAEANLRARVAASPKLPFHAVYFAAKPPRAGWKSGAVSWVAVDTKGTIFEIQRGDKADPVLVLDCDGRVLRSWGKGGYTIPHSIRLDAAGDVWTVDAASSIVTKYSPLGEKLLTFKVDGQPVNGSLFNGATDIAFGPRGRIFITDGYGNARVLEYTPDGRRVKQWGEPGTGPGEFHLPHAIQIGSDGTIYVADRENGRIEEFDLNGNFLGEIARLGRVYSLKLAGDVLWAGMGPLNQPAGSPGWVVKLDRQTGRILGHLDVPEVYGAHALDLMRSGEPIITLGEGLLWFKAN